VAALTAGVGRPIGQVRATWFVVVMSLVTLGIYTLYWTYKSFAELRRYRGRGLHPLAGVLLLFVLVSGFLLPGYVGRMYAEDEWDDPPISGWSGCYILIPYLGSIIWQVRVQNSLNRFWEATASLAVGTA
jgi:hypothetical protein